MAEKKAQVRQFRTPGMSAREADLRYHRQNVYTDGNTVRRVLEVQEPVPVSAKTRKNREKALEMNLGYVIFLAVAAILTVMICVNYLRLQAAYTSLQKTGTSLEARLASLKLENDTQYDRIMSSVNLEEIKDTAMNRLGMIYASADQIVTYQPSSGDYAKQYLDVPDY